MRPHVVIIGGGFGGLYAARALRNAHCRITLVDKHNHHLFQPLLYQVATGALNPSDIAAPIRWILRAQRNVTVILGEAVSIDTASQTVTLADGELSYDYLIVAAGATQSYFDHPEWAASAPGLKTMADALEIRRRVFLAFEAAERESDPEKRRAWLTFVVVGGGPTGVELAGALSEIARQSMAGEFRNIDPSDARVILVEGHARVLPLYPPSLSSAAQRQLEAAGVEVRTSVRVTSMSDAEISLGHSSIATRTILWAAGMIGSPLARSLNVPLDRAGRVLVHSDLTIPGHPNVFVIGDLAAARCSDGSLVPGVAQGAIQGGLHAASNVRRAIDGWPMRAFRYNDRGSLATVGRAAAVADLGNIRLAGFVAWLLWLGLHVSFLIGFRSRLIVMTQWVWAFLTRQRGARLITRSVES